MNKVIICLCFIASIAMCNDEYRYLMGDQTKEQLYTNIIAQTLYYHSDDINDGSIERIVEIVYKKIEPCKTLKECADVCFLSDEFGHWKLWRITKNNAYPFIRERSGEKWIICKQFTTLMLENKEFDIIYDSDNSTKSE